MCGFIFQNSKGTAVNIARFSKELDSIQWRGPDAKKIVVLNDDKTALGHCRLAILDLNSRADQPCKQSVVDIISC